jgi:hypothetical protein
VIPLFLMVNALLGFTQNSFEKRLEGTCLFSNFENVPANGRDGLKFKRE